MSRECGIPTFREAPSALWENYDPADLATPEGFQKDPATVWKWYGARRETIAKVEPHAGHFSLAELEQMDWEHYLLITQNIDNLHRVAGSSALVEIHGNIFRFKCFDPAPPGCGAARGRSGTAPVRVRVLDTSRRGLVRGDAAPRRARGGGCGHILVRHHAGGGHLRNGLSRGRVSRAGPCRAGARVIEVNPERTPITTIAEVYVEGTAGEALPALVEAVRRKRAA